MVYQYNLFLLFMKEKVLTKIIASFLILVFLLSSCGITQAATLPYMPEPGQMLAQSANYDLPYAVGIRFDPADPLKFTFMVDKGQNVLSGSLLRREGQKIVRYFLAALTIPEEDLWVNLSPYEASRIVPDKLSVTDLGRDMLGEDYVLKQMAASLTYPETEQGKKYWDAAKGGEQSFNKIWIMPGKIHIYEEEGKAYIDKAQLKVMMEEDYLARGHAEGGALRAVAMQKNNIVIASAAKQSQPKIAAVGNSLPRNDTTAAFKTHILPLIEKEVNTGKNFAQLRQLYYSVILASWFKERLKNSFLNDAYFNKRKVRGVDTTDPKVREQIYQEYLEAFKKGVYNYVKKEFVGANNHSPAQKIIKRQYFSGGEVLDVRGHLVKTPGIPAGIGSGCARVAIEALPVNANPAPDHNIACGTMTDADHTLLTVKMAEKYLQFQNYLNITDRFLTPQETIEAAVDFRQTGGLSAQNLQSIMQEVRQQLNIPSDVEIFFTPSENNYELYYVPSGAYAAGHFSRDGKRIHVPPLFLARRGKDFNESLKLAVAIARHELGHIEGKGDQPLPDFLQEAIDRALAADRQKKKAEIFYPAFGQKHFNAKKSFVSLGRWFKAAHSLPDLSEILENLGDLRGPYQLRRLNVVINKHYSHMDQRTQNAIDGVVGNYAQLKFSSVSEQEYGKRQVAEILTTIFVSYDIPLGLAEGLARRIVRDILERGPASGIEERAWSFLERLSADFGGRMTISRKKLSGAIHIAIVGLLFRRPNARKMAVMSEDLLPLAAFPAATDNARPVMPLDSIMGRRLAVGGDQRANHDQMQLAAMEKSAQSDIMAVIALLHRLAAPDFDKKTKIEPAILAALERFCRAALRRDRSMNRWTQAFTQAARNYLAAASDDADRAAAGAILALSARQDIFDNRSAEYFLYLCNFIGITRLNTPFARQIIGLVKSDPKTAAAIDGDIIYKGVRGNGLARQMSEEEVLFETVDWLLTQGRFSEDTMGGLREVRSFLGEQALLRPLPGVSKLIGKIYSSVALDGATIVPSYVEGACPWAVFKAISSGELLRRPMPASLQSRLKKVVFRVDPKGESVYAFFGEEGEAMIVELAEKLQEASGSQGHRKSFVKIAKAALGDIVDGKTIAETEDYLRKEIRERLGILVAPYSLRRELAEYGWVYRLRREALSPALYEFARQWQNLIMGEHASPPQLSKLLVEYSFEIAKGLANFDLDTMEDHITHDLLPELREKVEHNYAYVLKPPEGRMLSQLKTRMTAVKDIAAERLAQTHRDDMVAAPAQGFNAAVSIAEGFIAAHTQEPADQTDITATAMEIVIIAQRETRARAEERVGEIIFKSDRLDQDRREEAVRLVDEISAVLNPVNPSAPRKVQPPVYISCGNMTQAGHEELRRDMRYVYGSMADVVGKPKDAILSEKEVIRAAVKLGKTGGLSEDELNDIIAAVRADPKAGITDGQKIFFTPARGNTRLYYVHEAEEAHSAGHVSGREGGSFHIPPLFLAELPTQGARIAAVKEIIKHELGHLKGLDHGDAGMDISPGLQSKIEEANQKDLALLANGGVSFKNAIRNAVVERRGKTAEASHESSAFRQSMNIIGLDFKITAITLPR